MTSVTDFIAKHNINSYVKLNLLMYLNEFPNRAGTCEEFASLLYLPSPALQELLDELVQSNLLSVYNNRYLLSNQREVGRSLDLLSSTFENPVLRQEILLNFATA